MTILTTIVLGALLGVLLPPSPRHAFGATQAPPAPAGAVSPHLHVDPGGALYLLWQDMRDPQAGRIFFTRSPDRGQSWVPAASALDWDTPAGARSSSPRCARARVTTAPNRSRAFATRTARGRPRGWSRPAVLHVARCASIRSRGGPGRSRGETAASA